MELEDFDYDLPESLIAQHPLAERTASRLLHVPADGALRNLHFPDVIDLVQAGDVMVVNNTKVINARLFGTKDSGGQVEILVERLISEHEALCQVRASKPLKVDRTLVIGDGVEARCLSREGQFYELSFSSPLDDVLETYGHVPLPPYIQRADDQVDESRYQTVFGEEPGAVAAPTAGLHFDELLLNQLKEKGVQVVEVTLHVGAGTFQPVRGALADHVMHREWFEVPEGTAAAILCAKEEGRRIIAVGTTVVRTLESVMATGCMRAASGETQLFIQPGFTFQCVDALITNFHLPRSTLLMLVSAFSGQGRIQDAYRHAVKEQYRFFSYGDAMWLDKALDESCE